MTLLLRNRDGEAGNFVNPHFCAMGRSQLPSEPGIEVTRMIAALALFVAACGPTTSGPPDIRIADAWARAAAADKTVTAAYFDIANGGDTDDALVAVTSRTGPAEVHSTSMDGGIMRMRKLDRLAIPANSTVKLEPGGTHLMLTGLAQPLAAGGKVDLTLRFEKSGERKVVAAVRSPSGARM